MASQPLSPRDELVADVELLRSHQQILVLILPMPWAGLSEFVRGRQRPSESEKKPFTGLQERLLV